MTDSIVHPLIGKIRANTSQPEVLRFLGLQYASVSDRFAPAQMRTYDTEGTVDATRHGPSCLTIPNGEDFEQRLLQHTLPYDRDAVSMSDTEGLVLNITVPLSHIPPSNHKLPVFVFIHGGGYLAGCSRFPQYDMTRFVRLAEQNGMPIIAVSLNYRLGAPGFMTSKEMQSAGYLPNNALRDQRTALEWIQRYIAGFGGDPDRVTLMGESAGGVSAGYHLHSEKPLFRRIMCMSGTMLLEPPRPPEYAEMMYQKAVNALGLESMVPSERLKVLVKIDMHELRNKLMGAGVRGVPILDRDLCPERILFETLSNGQVHLSGAKWCEAMIQGDCQFDGSIVDNVLRMRKDGIASAFKTSVQHSLEDQPASASALLSGYGLGPEIADKEDYVRILEFASDINWYIPTIIMLNAVATDMDTYMYRFNAPNTWPGQWQGKTPHIYDLVLLLQNFDEFLPAEQQALSHRFASDVIAFVNGKEPWKKWQNSNGSGPLAMVMKPDGSTEECVDSPESTGRRHVIRELEKSMSLDRMRQVLDSFLASPPK